MFAFLGVALGWARKNPLVVAAGLLLAVLALALVLIRVGASGANAKRDAADARATAAAVTRNSAALETAAGERAADTAHAAATEKELNDAVQALPDSVPSARRVALGCARLRRAGQDTARLAQCP